MRIGFDVDDVVADLLTAWLNSYNAQHKTKWTPQDLTQWKFQVDLGCTDKEIFDHLQPELYDTVLPVPGALAVVNALRNLGHQIVYITTCHDEATWNAKLRWLGAFGFYRRDARDEAWPVGPWAQHKSKAEVGKSRAVDWLVDDSVDNCEKWPGVAYLMVQPHNKRSLTPIKRLKKLEDLMLEVKHAPSSLTVPLEANAGGWVNPAQNDVLKEIPKELLADSSFKALYRDPGTKPSNPKDIIGSDKMPLHLWPETATLYGTLGMLEGALKYGRNNFRAVGVRATIYIDAARRHLNAWASGEDTAPDSGLPHLGHALACIAILVEALAQGNLEDDRDYKGDAYLKLLEKLTPEVKRLKAKYIGSSPKHYTKKDNAL